MQQTAKEEEEKARRKEAVDEVLGDLPFGGRTDSINLNPKGLLTKLAEKNKETANAES
jgi:hypothetical protein